MLPVLLLIATLVAPTAYARFSAGAGLRYFTGDRRFDDAYAISGAALSVGYDKKLGEFGINAEGRAFVQSHPPLDPDQHTDLDLREAYLSWDATPDVRVNAGRKLVAWGRGDFLNPTDIISPRLLGLLVEEAWSEQKSGAWLAQGRWVTEGAGTFELDLVPRFRRTEVYSGGRLIADRPLDGGVKQDGVGARWDRDWSSFELGLSYFNGIDPMGNIGIYDRRLSQYYRRVNMFGLDGVLPLGSWAMRWESAFLSINGRTHEVGERMNEWFSLVGVDRRWGDLHLIVQGLIKKVYGFGPNPFRGTPLEAVEQISRFFHLQQKALFRAASLRPSYSFHDGLFEGDVLYLFELGAVSYLVRPRVTYRASDALRVAAGWEYWGGGDDGSFNFFRANKLAFVEASYAF